MSFLNRKVLLQGCFALEPLKKIGLRSNNNLFLLCSIGQVITGPGWGGGSAAAPAETLNDLAPQIAVIRNQLRQTFVKIALVPKLVADLVSLQTKLNHQPVNTQSQQLVSECELLKNYADNLLSQVQKLQRFTVKSNEIDAKNDAKLLDSKKSPIATVNRDVFKYVLGEFLNIKDWTTASAVCKLWQSRLYTKLIPLKLMTVNSNVAIRLPSQLTLSEFNGARKKAANAALFWQRNTPPNLPNELSHVVMERIKNKAVNDDKQEKQVVVSDKLNLR